MIDYADAIDEMFKMFFDAWQVFTPVEIGYIGYLEWPGVEVPEKRDLQKFWARVNQQGVSDEQRTLQTEGYRKFENEGLLWVQIFAPRSLEGSFETLRKLASLGRDVYKGKSTPGQIWFRNARIKEQPAEDKFYRCDVIAEYNFCEKG